ncbi:glycosyltransferase family 4 protein [Flavobacterium subsaxonicum]|nr:glycosyltransferase [Flavobacterium subsaxonicum]
MPKKRILLYSTQLMETGGIESHVKEFISQVAPLDNVLIDLVVLRANNSLEQKQMLRQYCTRTFLPSGKTIQGKLGFLLFVLGSVFTKYDALYTNGQGESISLIKKMFRFKKWVHHHHTSGDLADQQTWGPSYKVSLSEADTVVACSKKNAKDMQLALKRDVITIPCFSRKIVLDRVKQPKVSSDKVNLGYYGRLIPEKGIDILCRLSNEENLNHIQFHIWGEGQMYPASFFYKYPNIKYHGQFNGQEELKQVLVSIDGYLLLSVHPEGLPISLLEIMSAGIPWMATDKGGISDIACDPVATRVIESLEPYGDLKQKINQFAIDIAAGKIDRENQVALYDTKFSPKVLVKEWLNVLFTN